MVDLSCWRVNLVRISRIAHAQQKAPVLAGAGEGRDARLSYAFAAQLECGGLKAPEIARSHIEVARTPAVRFVRLTHQAAGTPILRPLSFVVHLGLRSSPVRPDGARLGSNGIDEARPRLWLFG